MKTKKRAARGVVALVMLAVTASCAASPQTTSTSTTTSSPTTSSVSTPLHAESAVAGHASQPGSRTAGTGGSRTAGTGATTALHGTAAGATRATITGHFLQIGGPAPGGQITAIAGAVAAYPNSTGSGTPAARTTSDSTGRFTFHVPPGTYYVFGADPLAVGPGGHPTLVSSQRPVVGRQGAVTTVDLRLYVP